MILQVKNYDIHEDGKTTIEIIYNRNRTGHGYETDKRTFDTSKQADAYLVSCAREIILVRIERYLANIQRIANKDEYFYNYSKKMVSLKYLWDKLTPLNAGSFEQVAKNTDFLTKNLLSVLPADNHPDYENLNADILEIIQFAKDYKQIINPLLSVA